MGLNVLTMSIKPTWISVYVGPAPNMQRGAGVVTAGETLITETNF